MTHEDYMREAIKEAGLAAADGNGPFGTVVVDGRTGDIICREHDRVTEYSDPTAHGDLLAVQQLCREHKTLSLSHAIFYATSEPCPTCMTALIKAKVPKIYYGADIETTASLPIRAEALAAQSKKHPIEVVGGILAEECLAQRNET